LNRVGSNNVPTHYANVSIDLQGLYNIHDRLRSVWPGPFGTDRILAAEFQKILDHRNIGQNSITGTLTHLGFARAYALQGDTPKPAPLTTISSRCERRRPRYPHPERSQSRIRETAVAAIRRPTEDSFLVKKPSHRQNFEAGLKSKRFVRQRRSNRHRVGKIRFRPRAESSDIFWQYLQEVTGNPA
jgi:hypothetical protein